MSNASVERLEAKSREITWLAHILAVLGYDQETMMPSKGAPERGEQMAVISGLLHDRVVDPGLGKLVEELWAKRDSLSPEAQANVRELRRSHLRSRKVPKELVEEIARTQPLAHEAWIKARKASDFASFAPWLEKMFDLKRREADAIGFEADRYDALLDQYEPGMTVARLNPLFEQLRKDLVPIVHAIAAAPRRPDESLLTRRVPQEQQVALCLGLARSMGFDTEGGRMDVSTHPFCSTLGSGDVRITNRYNEGEPLASFFGVMHETGHALYEQGIDPANHGLPMGEAVSLGIHESQSRTWENMVGRGRPFWKHFYPTLQKAWSPAYDGVDPEAFYFAVNTVRPSMIRVEADEVTYNLHILVRYEIERDLFAGRLAVKDLPSAWNGRMKEYLGIKPKNDAEGVLQDIHWSSGLIGYFPTYTLGNLYGAQIFDAVRRQIPDLDARIGRGDLETLREWLREKVHRHGMRWLPADLVREVTGQEPDASYYMRYLREKFGPLYGIQA
ncbi:MAG: carboxypeptidase M32 [Candidatus Eisenbacteria bacterium]|nr:carboxypeptidase M32 [Candidatus Eisenbacteria bacterium]